jgi:hypothetical protein
MQWAAAVRRHAEFRRALHRLRTELPPQTATERELLREFRAHVQQFARELLRGRGIITAARLNEISASADTAWIDYVIVRRSREWECELLERMITPQMSAEVIDYLVARGWSVRGIARAIDAPVEFVKRTRSKLHCLLMSDLEALAKTEKTTAHRLVFESMATSRLSPKMRKLHEITAELLHSSDEFAAAMRRRPAKKRRRRAKAA